jgi:hypothetical protein
MTSAGRSSGSQSGSHNWMFSARSSQHSSPNWKLLNACYRASPSRSKAGGVVPDVGRALQLLLRRLHRGAGVARRVLLRQGKALRSAIWCCRWCKRIPRGSPPPIYCISCPARGTLYARTTSGLRCSGTAGAVGSNSATSDGIRQRSQARRGERTVAKRVRLSGTRRPLPPSRLTRPVFVLRSLIGSVR